MKAIKILIAATICIIIQPVGFVCQCLCIGFVSGQQMAIDMGEEVCNDLKKKQNENNQPHDS